MASQISCFRISSRLSKRLFRSEANLSRRASTFSSMRGVLLNKHFVESERSEDFPLYRSHRMVQRVLAIVPVDRLDFFQLTNRYRNVHEVPLFLVFKLGVLQPYMNPIADNERDELDENLCGCGFIRTHSHALVSKERLVCSEKFFGAVTTLVNSEGLSKSTRAFSVHCVNDK